MGIDIVAEEVVVVVAVDAAVGSMKKQRVLT